MDAPEEIQREVKKQLDAVRSARRHKGDDAAWEELLHVLDHSLRRLALLEEYVYEED